MAVEKDKVLAAIELKFKGKSITKTFKDKLATSWAAKIESEDGINEYIEDREEIINEAAAEADRRAQEAADKAKLKTEDPNPTELPKVDDKDVPEWAKSLIDSNKALQDKLTGFETAQQQKSIAERFKSDERLKGIPEFAFKGRIPATEADFETAVTELATDFSTFATEAKLTTFGKDAPPAGGIGGKNGSPKEASAAEIDAIANKVIGKK